MYRTFDSIRYDSIRFDSFHSMRYDSNRLMRFNSIHPARMRALLRSGAPLLGGVLAFMVDVRDMSHMNDMKDRNDMNRSEHI